MMPGVADDGRLGLSECAGAGLLTFMAAYRFLARSCIQVLHVPACPPMHCLFIGNSSVGLVTPQPLHSFLVLGLESFRNFGPAVFRFNSLFRAAGAAAFSSGAESTRRGFKAINAFPNLQLTHAEVVILSIIFWISIEGSLMNRYLGSFRDLGGFCLIHFHVRLDLHLYFRLRGLNNIFNIHAVDVISGFLFVVFLHLPGSPRESSCYFHPIPLAVSMASRKLRFVCFPKANPNPLNVP
jgi:hypothetical protein